jgi:hypothetical protein
MVQEQSASVTAIYVKEKESMKLDQVASGGTAKQFAPAQLGNG